MTPLPKSLSEKCVAEAMKLPCTFRMEGFLKGVQFLYEALLSDAGAFDYDAHEAHFIEVDSVDEGICEESHIMGARWQHQQTQAKLAARDLRIKELEAQVGK